MFRTVLQGNASDNPNHAPHSGHAPIAGSRRHRLRGGDKLGYHIATAVQDHAVLETPAVSGTLDSLRSDLEDILVAQGLYRDEARAMLETWGDSWFEQGSRLIYIAPRAYVDSILPLSIRPAPAKLARVFVGRLELITPATEKSIEAAIASRDSITLRKYGRFLYPDFQRHPREAIRPSGRGPPVGRSWYCPHQRFLN